MDKWIYKFLDWIDSWTSWIDDICRAPAKNESVDQIYDRLAMMDEWYEWFDLDKMDGMDYIVLEDTTQQSEI